MFWSMDTNEKKNSTRLGVQVVSSIIDLVVLALHCRAARNEQAMKRKKPKKNKKTSIAFKHSVRVGDSSNSELWTRGRAPEGRALVHVATGDSS